MGESMGKRLRDEGIKAGLKAVAKLLEDPRRADFLANAVQHLQSGKVVVDEVTGRLRNLAELPSREDIHELSRLASRLRRELKQLAARVQSLLDGR